MPIARVVSYGTMTAQRFVGTSVGTCFGGCHAADRHLHQDHQAQRVESHLKLSHFLAESHLNLSHVEDYAAEFFSKVVRSDQREHIE